MNSAKGGRQWGLFGIAALFGLVVFLFVSFRVFGGGGTWEDFTKSFNETPSASAILFVNGLVGVSVALFIVQLRWNALRVTITVLAALVLGYLVTAGFNLDASAKYTSGEFKVSVLSQAEPIKQDGVDLTYGKERGGEFNKPGALNPLTESKLTFAGKQGDVVTVMAYAANRRSLVNMQTELLDASGQSLASSTSATPEQVEALDGLRSENDAVIADFTLPADGVYSILSKPEVVPTSLALKETTDATNVAYEAFLLGALGRSNRWAVWIQDALTLILIGLAVAVVFRAQQFCLGAEGQLYMGALVSGAICLAWTNVSPLLVIPAAVLGAMVAGFLWGMLPGVLKAYLGANELVSSLMLNTIATRFFEMILTFQLMPPNAGYTASEKFIPDNTFLPIIQDTQVTTAIFIVIAAVLVVWLLINRTTLGYEIRMVGANQRFADYGGINTKRVVMLSMAVSGIFAGLAGAHLAMGIHRQLLLNISTGIAFQGVVVALLARNNPLVIPFTGFLYAYLRAGAQFMERDSNVSFEVVSIIQAVIILLITADALAAFMQNRRATQKAQQGS